MVKLKSNTNILFKKIYKNQLFERFFYKNKLNLNYKIHLQINGVNHYKLNALYTFCKKYNLTVFFLSKKFFKGKSFIIFSENLEKIMKLVVFLETTLNPVEGEIITVINFLYFSKFLGKNQGLSISQRELLFREVKSFQGESLQINLLNIIIKTYRKRLWLLQIQILANLIKCLVSIKFLTKNLK